MTSAFKAGTSGTSSLWHEADEHCAVAQLHVTRNAWQRARGLLLRPPLAPGEGLLLQGCAAIHTLGMRYPLDIAFLDADLLVCHCVSGLPPLRLAACREARHTLELPPGGLVAGRIAPGMRLRLGPATPPA